MAAHTIQEEHDCLAPLTATNGFTLLSPFAKPEGVGGGAAGGRQKSAQRDKSATLEPKRLLCNWAKRAAVDRPGAVFVERGYETDHRNKLFTNVGRRSSDPRLLSLDKLLKAQTKD